MQRSSIMIMDEPSNAMDQTSESILLTKLKEALKDQTLLLITQKLSLLDMTDRIIVMHHSKVLLDGTKEEVTKQLGGVK
jgi:ATP-binding cassette subfamily C protein LapB